MGLALRVLSFLGSVLLRAALLVAALFLAHLLLSRALPELEATMRAIDQRPTVERDLAAREAQLARDVLAARELERQLGARSRSAWLESSRRLSDFERHLGDLESRRTALVERLKGLQRERDETCASYNPLDWWACRRLRARFEALSESLTPLIGQLETDVEAARASIAQLLDELRVLEDPNLDDAEKLRRLGLDEDSEASLLLAASKQRIENARREATALARELERTTALEASPVGFLLREWRAVRSGLLGIVALVLALPYVFRMLNYFVLMPLVSRFAAPVLLSATESGELRCDSSRRTLAIQLSEGEHASVRSEYARPVKGRVSGRLLYRLSAPFISYAAGLRLLTRVDGTRGATTEITLAAPDDPNAYLMRLDLENHPGVVIHPKHLVGVIGDLELATRWRPFSLHAWATWQLRYILLSGTGSLVVEGSGDVIATAPGGDAPTKIEQKLVIGFDSRLLYRCARTEIFWPYLFGKTPLVDDVFSGPGPFLWQKSTSSKPKNPVVRTFDAVFSALGKLFGF